MGELSAEVALDLSNIADIYRKQKNFEQSAQLFKKTLEIDEQLYGEDNQEVITDLSNLATV